MEDALKVFTKGCEACPGYNHPRFQRHDLMRELWFALNIHNSFCVVDRNAAGNQIVPGAHSGADYAGNILRRRQQRRDVQPPLRLRDPALNSLSNWERAAAGRL